MSAFAKRLTCQNRFKSLCLLKYHENECKLRISKACLVIENNKEISNKYMYIERVERYYMCLC